MLIGWDRERREYTAGLRTHMLVGIGACLLTIVSRYAFPPSTDVTRIVAQIVSGIGFLGAGAILKQDEHIHGLTTAATIWVTAAIGIAVGAEVWLLALATTVIIWIVLVVVRKAEAKRPSPGDDKTRASG